MHLIWVSENGISMICVARSRVHVAVSIGTATGEVRGPSLTCFVVSEKTYLVLFALRRANGQPGFAMTPPSMIGGEGASSRLMFGTWASPVLTVGPSLRHGARTNTGHCLWISYLSVSGVGGWK